VEVVRFVARVVWSLVEVVRLPVEVVWLFVEVVQLLVEELIGARVPAQQGALAQVLVGARVPQQAAWHSRLPEHAVFPILGACYQEPAPHQCH